MPGQYYGEEGIEIRRVILDTNVYEKIIEQEERGVIRQKIERDRIVIYGIEKVIRKELRDTPAKVRVRKMQLRIALLSVYDDLVGRHDLNIAPLTNFLARCYFDEYRKNRGRCSWEKLKNDFLIVACATLNRLDIIVTDDEATMTSEPAIKAYDIVNKENRFRTPRFLKYGEFRKL